MFLAYIKKEDRLKPAVGKILNGIQSSKLKGVYASTATIQEIVFWFFNRQLYRELVEAVNAITHIRNLRWVDVSPEVCLNASILMDEYGVNPFDAYHAATAVLEDKTILSTEHVYDRIKGVKRIEPEDFAKGL